LQIALIRKLWEQPVLDHQDADHRIDRLLATLGTGAFDCLPVEGPPFRGHHEVIASAKASSTASRTSRMPMPCLMNRLISLCSVARPGA
jgi:hypothetical protein